jgi:hypothetical protein
MPTKPGEYCLRCGTKCITRIEGDQLIYECPKQHGIQLIEKAPEQAAVDDGPSQETHSVDDVPPQDETQQEQDETQDDSRVDDVRQAARGKKK